MSEWKNGVLLIGSKTSINEGRSFGCWGAENQWFVFKHIKFKMPIGYPLEILSRQLDIRVCSAREVQVAYKFGSIQKVFLVMKLCGSLGMSMDRKEWSSED